MAAPIEVLLTDVARLVLAYLYDEKMDELAHQFCQQNPLLEQERAELEASGRAVNYCVTTLPVLVQSLCEDHHRLQLLLEKYDQGYRFVQDPSITLIEKIELLLVERIDKMFSVASRMGSPLNDNVVGCTEGYSSEEAVHNPQLTNSAAPPDPIQPGMGVPLDENEICWLLPNRSESDSCSTTSNLPVAVREPETISMMELVQVDGCSMEEKALAEPAEQRYCYEVPEVWLASDENDFEPALTVEVSAEQQPAAAALAICADEPDPVEYSSAPDLASLDASKTPVPTVDELPDVRAQLAYEQQTDKQDHRNTEVFESEEAKEQQQQQHQQLQQEEEEEEEEIESCQNGASGVKRTPRDKRVVIDLGLANIIPVVAANTSPTLIASHRPATVQSATSNRPAMAVRPIMVVQPSSLPLTSSSVQQMVSPTTKALVERRTHVRRLVFDIPPMMPLKRMALGTTAVGKGEQVGTPADVSAGDGATSAVATTINSTPMVPPNADAPKPKTVRRTAAQIAQDAAEWKRIRSVNISNFDMHLRTVIAEQEKRRQEVESKRLLALRLERKRVARAKQRALAVASGSNNRRKAATTKLTGTVNVARKRQPSPTANESLLATPNTTQKQAAMIEAALASPIIVSCAKLPSTDGQLPRQTFHQCLMVEASISTDDGASTSGWLPTVPPPCPVPLTPNPSRPNVFSTITPMLQLSNEDSDSPYKIDPVTDIPQTPRFRIPIHPSCSPPPHEHVDVAEQHKRNLLGELDSPSQATLVPNPSRPITPGLGDSINSTTSKFFECAPRATVPTEAEPTNASHHHKRTIQMNPPEEASNKQITTSSPPPSPARVRGKLSAVPVVSEPGHPPMSPMENEREHKRLIKSALRRKRKAEEAMKKATAMAADNGRIDHGTPMGFGSPKMYHVLLVGRAAASGRPVGARKRPKRYQLEEDDPVMEVFNGEARFTIARSELAVHYEQRSAHEETIMSASGASCTQDSAGSDSDSSSSSSSSSSSNISKNTSTSNSSSTSSNSNSSSSSSSNSNSRVAVVLEAEEGDKL